MSLIIEKLLQDGRVRNQQTRYGYRCDHRVTTVILVTCYLLIDGLASSSASVFHVAYVVAVVGVLEGVDRLCIHNCRRETIPTVDRMLTEEKLPYVESWSFLIASSCGLSSHKGSVLV